MGDSRQWYVSGYRQTLIGANASFPAGQMNVVLMDTSNPSTVLRVSKRALVNGVQQSGGVDQLWFEKTLVAPFFDDHLLPPRKYVELPDAAYRTFLTLDTEGIKPRIDQAMQMPNLLNSSEITFEFKVCQVPFTRD